jgi:beta-lactamase regulating signal transducer with metallopeptidase domain
MTSLIAWTGTAVVEALGWTLIHFIWEGAALALLLYVLLAFSRSATMRYALSLGVLAAMALAPLVTFALLRQQPHGSSQWPAAFGTLQQPLQVLGTVTNVAPAAAQLPASSFSTAAGPAVPVDWLAVFVSLWCCGVTIFALRALGGWLVLSRLHRDTREALGAALLARCRALENRLGIRRSVRYFQTSGLDTPALMGWFRPVILLPFPALAALTDEQLEAVLLHELAHLRRLDSFVNLFQIVIETVLFYHPAVWWANRVARDEREDCCDDIAVSISGDACEYARALTQLEEARATPVWALAANGGVLKQRVARLLGLATVSRGASASGAAAIGVLCAAGFLLAGASFARQDPPDVPVAEAPASPAAISSPVAPASPGISAAPAVPRVSPRPRSVATPAVAVAYAADYASDPPDEPQAREAATPPPSPAPSGHSYIEDLQAVGVKDLNVDDLIALKIQGVTPDYIRQMRAAGLNPTVRELIGMKIQGVTPEYIQKVRTTWPEATIRDVISLKIQGVDASDTAEYRRLGLDDLSLRRLVELKIQGVTPDYIRSLQAAGFHDMKTRDYISAKIQGVDSEFIQKVRSHGFKDLTLRQLIALKTAGVF